MTNSPTITSKVNEKSDIEFWSRAWENKQALWQKENIHPNLLNFWDLLFPSLIDNSKNAILFPLCGQTLDMVYSSKEKGVKTIGIEGVGSAITDFFKANQLLPYNEYNITHHEKQDEEPISTPIYSYTGNSDGKEIDIKILQQNYFLTGNIPLNSEISQVQGIFDRGSLTAINPSLRVEYVNTIMKWLCPGGRILLNIPFYDQTKVNGPPFSATPSEVMELYSPYGSIELIDTSPGVIHGIAPAEYNCYLIIKNL